MNRTTVSEAALEQAVTNLAQALEQHPECNGLAADMAVAKGQPRPYAVFSIVRPPDLDAGEGSGGFNHDGRRKQMLGYDAGQLLEEVRGLVGPLKMANPIRPLLSLGMGPGTLTASFGCRLNAGTNFCPENHITLEALFAQGVPDATTSGLMPVIHEKIDCIRQYLPDWIKIQHPDMQGPFNLAHMVLGDEAFTAPLERPGDFHRAMTLITDFFLAVERQVAQWIGVERLDPKRSRRFRIAECSTNMISAEIYREHVLPHDRRVARTWGGVGIHTCSGPHVFHATLEGIGRITDTEAGYIPRATAGWTRVDQALEAIGERPIVLRIGQELPPGREEQTIRQDLDRLVENPRLELGYAGMHWKKKDDAFIRDLHLRLNEYYQQVRSGAR